MDQMLHVCPRDTESDQQRFIIIVIVLLLLLLLLFYFLFFNTFGSKDYEG